jgi:hypothetical protein
VIKQQQWQIGDSLLNSEFGRLASDLARDLGTGPKLRDRFIRIGRLTRGCSSVKDRSDDNQAYRATTYLLGVLTGRRGLAVPCGGTPFVLGSADARSRSDQPFLSSYRTVGGRSGRFAAAT